MDTNIEELKKEIKNKIAQAQEAYDENAAISINAYGTGYEKGALDVLTEILELSEEIGNKNTNTLSENSLKEVIKRVLEKEFNLITELDLYILAKGQIRILLAVFKDEYCSDNELFSRTFMFKLGDVFKSEEDLFNHIISTNKK